MTSNPPLNAPPRANRLQIAALAAIMAWPLLIIDRGFDLTDSGYYLFNYRYAFSWPEVNSLTMLLSNWAGGALIQILPETGQFLALRAVCAILYAGITWLSWLILREHFPAWLNIGALALANAYSTALIYTFSYNSLTYGLLSATVLLLYRGLARDKPLLLYLAGALLGLNVFTRPPNILHWALAAAVFWHYWFCLQKRSLAVSRTLRFTLSVLLAWLIMFGLVRLAMGPAWLSREIEGLADLLFSQRDFHSVYAMWDGYDIIIRRGLHQLSLAAPVLAPLALVLGAGVLMSRGRKTLKAALAALGLATPAALALLGGDYYTNAFSPRLIWETPLESWCVFLSVAGPLVALAGLCWYHQRRPALSSLGAMVLVIFLAMPLGSDYNMLQYTYYAHLPLAVVLGLVWRLQLDMAAWLGEKRPRLFVAGAAPALAAVNVFFWFLVVCGLKAASDNKMLGALKDVEYGAATVKVEGAPFLAGMKTHSSKAWWLGEVVRRTAPYRDLPLVVLGQCPLCFLLAPEKPLLPAPWLDLYSLPRDYLSRGLTEAARDGRPPLVLMVNQELDGAGRSWHNYGNEQTLLRFLEKNRYTLAAENLAFRLFPPPGRGEGQPVVFPKRRLRSNMEPRPPVPESAAPVTPSDETGGD